MSEARPEDILGYPLENTSQNKNIVTQSSVRVDETVTTLEDKVTHIQAVINYWRAKITQNERVITLFCVITGILFSYAINKCTRNLDIPASVYWLSAALIISFALLLISDGSLPLIVLVRFAISVYFGHYFMMWVVSIDGHYFGWLTADVCRYPISVAVTAGVIAGIFIGYIAKSFEEIRAARGK